MLKNHIPKKSCKWKEIVKKVDLEGIAKRKLCLHGMRDSDLLGAETVVANLRSQYLPSDSFGPLHLVSHLNHLSLHKEIFMSFFFWTQGF